jgi:hypothetical protein
MSAKALIANGDLLSKDHDFMIGTSVIIESGVQKNLYNECEVTLNSVDTGVVFVEVTRTTTTPNETFVIPVLITAPVVVDTSGTGYVIVRIDETKLNANTSSADGTDIVVVEAVSVLPTSNYVVLATLAAGVITDARTYTQLSEYILRQAFFYDEDAEANDDYVITLNGFLSYKDGAEFTFKANTSNTGTCTLNVNGAGAKAIKKKFDVDLDSNDIRAGQIVSVRYDADNDYHQLMSTPSTIASLIKASTSDALAGADDEKYMTSLKTKQAIDDRGFRSFDSYVVDEDFDVSDGAVPAFIADIDNNGTFEFINISGSGSDFDLENNTHQIGQIFQTPDNGGAYVLKNIDIAFDKFTATIFTGTVFVELFALDGSDEPTGVALESKSVTTTVLVDGVNTFAFNTALSSGTKYAIVVRIIGKDSDELIEVLYASNPVSPYVVEMLTTTDIGANWTHDSANGMRIVIDLDASLNGGKVYKTNNLFAPFNYYDGLVLETGVLGNSLKMQSVGKAGGYTGLTAGDTYYNADQSTSPTVPIATTGTNKVGIAVSATELFLNNH